MESILREGKLLYYLSELSARIQDIPDDRIDMFIEIGIVSPLYTCLRPKGIANAEYLLWYFQSGAWYRFIYENGAQNGARHDRVGMTDSLMQDIPVYVPRSLEEQQKIADCLSSLDDVIEKQKATLVAWEEMKKGLLQQMFV